MLPTGQKLTRAEMRCSASPSGVAKQQRLRLDLPKFDSGEERCAPGVWGGYSVEGNSDEVERRQTAGRPAGIRAKSLSGSPGAGVQLIRPAARVEGAQLKSPVELMDVHLQVPKRSDVGFSG